MSESFPFDGYCLGSCPSCNAVIQSFIPPHIQEIWESSTDTDTQYNWNFLHCPDCGELLEGIYCSDDPFIAHYVALDLEPDVLRTASRSSLLNYLRDTALMYLFPDDWYLYTESESGFLGSLGSIDDLLVRDQVDDSCFSVGEGDELIVLECLQCGGQMEYRVDQDIDLSSLQCCGEPMREMCISQSDLLLFLEQLDVDEVLEVWTRASSRSLSSVDVKVFQILLRSEFTIADLKRS